MTIPSNDSPKKRCTKCEKEYPPTLEYFTVEPLGKYGLSSKCRSCNAEKSRKYHAAHKEQEKEYARIHAEESKARSRAWYANHPEEVRQRNVKYRERYSEKIKIYRQSHRDEINALTRNRKARKKAAPGKHTSQDIQAQYDRQKGKCYYCHQKLTTYHVDHVIPLSKGGSNDPSNLVIACPSCNTRKNDKFWRLL